MPENRDLFELLAILAMTLQSNFKRLRNCFTLKSPIIVCILLLPLSFSSAMALVMSDCVGEGGNKLCSAPTPSLWVYRLCDNTGAYISRFRAWCEVSGGTYVFITGPGCTGRSPHAESNLVARAESFADRMSPQTNCAAIDSGWGQTTNSFQCSSGAPAYQNGFLIRDFRSLNVSNCGEHIFARRDRNLVCPSGATMYSIGNLKVCIEDQEFAECPSVGNPILPMTGKKIEREEDFHGPLPLSRIYSSELPFIPYNFVGNFPASRGQFGEHWRTNFAYRLFHLNGDLSRYAISFPNGAVEYFGPDLLPTTHLYKDGVLHQDGNQFTYSYDDLELRFSTAGDLQRLTKRGGIAYSFHYSGMDFPDPVYATLPGGTPSGVVLPTGLLLEIRDDGGQVVYHFSYDAGGRIVFIERGSEKLFYEYDFSENLAKVSSGDGLHRQYLYQNPVFKHALTGVVDEEGISFAAWSYDTSGRALSSTHDGGAETVFLDFSSVAETANPRILVTNALGKQTTYHYGVFQGVRRIKTIEGHASENCAAANRAYDYSPNGTLNSKTDWSGNTTTFVRDAFGRETSRTEASGTSQARTIFTEYHPTLNLPIRITEPGKVTLMTYDADGRLLSQASQLTP